MDIKEIAFTCYPVSGLAKARKFYEEILGLIPISTWIDGDNGMIEYEIGGSTLAIGAGADNFKPSSTGVSVALEVENFDEMIDKLNKNKVNFKMQPMDTPVCRMAIITDPDGSQIMIHKRKK